MAEICLDKCIFPTAAVDDLIAAHDGSMALVYLQAARSGGFDAVRCARDLCMTVAEVESACEKLKLRGIWPDSPAAPAVIPEPADEPTYQRTSAEIKQAAGNPEVKAIFDECAQIRGKQLTKDDMDKLLNVYETLGLGADVIYVLLHYCKMISRSVPTAAFIQKQAYKWVNKGITTAEQAEEYVESDLARRSGIGHLCSLIGVDPTHLTESLRDDLALWLSYGFSDEVIERAYETTFRKFGKLNMSYLGGILRKWNESGVPERSAKISGKTEVVYEPTQNPSTIRKKRT